MEYFYREMRKRTGFLMEDGEPVGGSWNFDAENRKRLPDDLTIPAPSRFAPDAITQEVLDLVEERFCDHFGTLDGFAWGGDPGGCPASAGSLHPAAAVAFTAIIRIAMKQGEPFLFHALISPCLNCGLFIAARGLRGRRGGL